MLQRGLFRQRDPRLHTDGWQVLQRVWGGSDPIDRGNRPFPQRLRPLAGVDGVQRRHESSVGEARETVNGDIFASLIIGGYFPPLTVLLRRSVLDEAGWFDENLGGHADYDLWLRLSATGHHALYVDKKLAYYRTHEGSMSSKWQHMFSTRQAALEKIARSCPDRFAGAVNRMIEDREEMYRAYSWLDNHYRELKDWVGELQKGKDWLEEQRKSLWAEVQHRDTVIDSTHKQLLELRRQYREKAAK